MYKHMLQPLVFEKKLSNIEYQRKTCPWKFDPSVSICFAEKRETRKNGLDSYIMQGAL